MHPQDVEDRLRAVLKELEGRRQGAKASLDEAWAKDPKAVDGLLSGLREAHSKYLEFADVSERALPLLQTLSRIAQLRDEAIEHLDRLSTQAEESRKLKSSLRPEELQTMESVPRLVGETFDLSLLAEDQIRMIREARAALAGSSEAPAASGDAPSKASGDAPPTAPKSTDATLDVTLEEWAAGQTDPPSAVESLPGDEALDAMFEEAMTGEPEDGTEEAATEPEAPVEAATTEPEPEPAAAEPEPEAQPPPEPAAPSGGAVDPLDELLTRAGFE